MSGKRVFADTRMFSYHRRMKIASGIVWVLAIASLVSLVLSYFLLLRNTDIPGVALAGRIISHIASNVSESTLLGVFYLPLIGGLFFILTPLEYFFGKFLASGHGVVLLFVVYLAGLSLSYSLNYLIGFKLSRLAKKLISPRKFYSTKGYINKYGAAAIFLFNATPLPSQLLAAILGVFKYNRTRFYVFFLLGQIVKLAVITLGIYYVF